MAILFYRRPDYITKSQGPMSLSTCQAYVEKTMKHKRSIPQELSFENVIQNKALPPCALQDFMDYLVYVSHDAENLQFWVWLRDYTNRFNSAPRSEQALSPPWSPEEAPQSIGNAEPFKTDFEVSFEAKDTPPLSSKPDNLSYTSIPIGVPMSPPWVRTDDRQLPTWQPSSPILSPTFDKQSFVSSNIGTNRSAEDSAVEANHAMGLKWQSFTIQPFRSEINRVISHYIAPDAPRELNLSHKTRAAVLHALQHTTHPSAFKLVKEIVELTLRGQSHPNFIRWSICNGNKPRMYFARTFGCGQAVLALLMVLLLLFSSKSRWWRLFAFPIWWLSFTPIVATFKGLCVIYHHNHYRGLRPWEAYSDGGSWTSFDQDNEANLSTSDIYSMKNRSKKGISVDTFGTANSYDHEMWVEKYMHKSIFRKIFERSVWIQDETIRLLQDRLVRQSQLWSLVISIPLTALFVALPEYGYY